MTLTYAIYQITSPETCNYAFNSYQRAQKRNFTMNDYSKVYTGTIERHREYLKEDIVEDLFYIFNLRCPEDFRGHSLSVSDIIELTDDRGKVTYHYCNTFGWEDITEDVRGCGLR